MATSYDDNNIWQLLQQQRSEERRLLASASSIVDSHKRRLAELQEIAKFEERRRSSSWKKNASTFSDQKHTLRKLLQDSDNLERFYKDKEYRQQLISQARYPSLEYAQLDNIYEQDRKVKHSLNLPENSTIKFEKAKGRGIGYFYAYFWNPELGKLKKRYIGKVLLPVL
jgi:hypothetical protein